MVFRIFVEKKPGLDNEARALLADARKFLGIKGLEKVRLLNRYDAENISEDLFSLAVREVFSEPQLRKLTAPQAAILQVQIAVQQARVGIKRHLQQMVKRQFINYALKAFIWTR